MPAAKKHSANTVPALCWPDGKRRSMGGPFDILYQPRAMPKPSTAPKKPGPKPSQSYHARTLSALRDPARSQFCTATNKPATQETEANPS